MRIPICKLLLLLIIQITGNQAKIMRNKALLSRMMSNFHKDYQNETPNLEEDKSKKKIVTLMQNVLCRNFRSIPCHMIIQDETLRRLIQESIQQIDNKKVKFEMTTQPTVTQENSLYQVVNSEDLSSFLQVQNTGVFKENPRKITNRQKKVKSNDWSPEKVHKKQKKSKKESKQTALLGRMALRKYYPHKYKDKGTKHELVGSEERSESGEQRVGRRLRYNPHSSSDPVWRIDYTKHGEPELSGLGGGQIRGKIIRTGGILVDDDLLEQAARKDVLHPDVYIKTNLVRRNAEDIEHAEVFDD